ncbi:O-antigen polymerase [Bacillus sp. V2I10]|uniref:O-antigen polymerase n=1 Tax=Bacillus sp. V2I10 TaxID=3042276 RepID=UPI002787E982|nr:O-antigen polymerase [Bacillus sp. V2I10]MDQ0857149.1 oligosaccharide repeat unit polymerase [Bacillus sp. V2I10]
MISLVAFILFIVLLVPMIRWRNQGGEMFAPRMIAFFFLILTTVPYLLSIAGNKYIIYPAILSRIGLNNLDQYIAYFALILIIGSLSLLLGLKAPLIKELTVFPVIAKTENKKRYMFAFFVTFGFGVLGYMLFLQKVGGFNVLVSNLHIRTQLTAGNGYLMSLTTTLLITSVVCYICSFKYKKTLLKFLFLIALVLFVAFMLSSFGGRKQTLQLIAFCVITWHYGVQRFRRIPLKIWFLVPILLVYIIAVPILRSPAGIDYYMNTSGALIEEIGNNLGRTTQQISYVDNYLLVLDHFSVDKIWYGRSFIDLLFAPIPSSIYPNKPPSDEGVYLQTIVQNWYLEVEPSKPFKELYPSSFPTETLGTMYMNFWIPGVFIGMFLLGAIYKLAYLYMKRSNYNGFSIMVYCFILLNFHLSNLRIIQTLMSILIISFFFFVLFPVKKKI